MKTIDQVNEMRNDILTAWQNINTMKMKAMMAYYELDYDCTEKARANTEYEELETMSHNLSGRLDSIDFVRYRTPDEVEEQYTNYINYCYQTYRKYTNEENLYARTIRAKCLGRIMTIQEILELNELPF